MRRLIEPLHTHARVEALFGDASPASHAIVLSTTRGVVSSTFCKRVVERFPLCELQLLPPT